MRFRSSSDDPGERRRPSQQDRNTVCHLRDWNIHNWLRYFRSEVEHIANYSDDLSCRFFKLGTIAVAKNEAASNRICVRPVPPGHGLINDCDSFRLTVVAVGKSA